MTAPSPTALDGSWRGWVAENVALGVPDGEIVSALRDAGHDAVTAAAEVERASAHPYLAAARRIAAEYGRAEALLDAYGQLRAADGGGVLERRRGVAPAEFFARYYHGHRPVVLQGLLDGSPAREWTFGGLRHRFGDVTVEVMTGREADPDHAWRYDAHRTPMPFGSYLDLVEAGPSNDNYMVPRNENWRRDGLAGMRDDIVPPAGIVPDDVLPEEMTLLLGPAGTVTPLHHDNMNILLCQVLGRKRVRLVPSFQRHLVYPRGGTFSHVDADAPDLSRFPDYASATVLETVLEPGEALFIPFGWWHWVRALDPAVTVSFHRFAVPGGNTYLSEPHSTGAA
ncbi:cupin-like domain-containing protein [Catellatospora bangladeshensis]|uniref:Aspartate beta-hydroxylase n=1 Tax=Catellatospora bangladeshensis TaxID=310355 RepID=A0A8J3JC36_9ACTN|nr:cupin-like domain-containing protein [Catellatospora bangladeshensis]GIF81546.1 aspartate beta-hydroxylase [Catellatospora bangladeshensis]